MTVQGTRAGRNAPTSGFRATALRNQDLEAPGDCGAPGSRPEHSTPGLRGPEPQGTNAPRPG